MTEARLRLLCASGALALLGALSPGTSQAVELGDRIDLHGYGYQNYAQSSANSYLGADKHGTWDNNFLGLVRTWPNGGSIAAFDLPEDNLSRSDFDAAIVGKGQGSLKSLWAQNVFTGKALPPKTASSDENVKKAVAANKNAIGYIQSGSADDTVKIAVRQ